MKPGELVFRFPSEVRNVELDVLEELRAGIGDPPDRLQILVRGVLDHHVREEVSERDMPFHETSRIKGLLKLVPRTLAREPDDVGMPRHARDQLSRPLKPSDRGLAVDYTRPDASR